MLTFFSFLTLIFHTLFLFLVVFMKPFRMEKRVFQFIFPRYERILVGIHIAGLWTAQFLSIAVKNEIDGPDPTTVPVTLIWIASLLLGCRDLIYAYGMESPSQCAQRIRDAILLVGITSFVSCFFMVYMGVETPSSIALGLVGLFSYGWFQASNVRLARDLDQYIHKKNRPPEADGPTLLEMLDN